MNVLGLCFLQKSLIIKPVFPFQTPTLKTRFFMATLKPAARHTPNPAKIAELTRQLLVELGEDPDREGLRDTPQRVARALAFLTSGYHTTPAKVIQHASFQSHVNNMIILRDVEVYSLCEHHLLPFYGRCHIGYIPSKKILGISKIARIVDIFARRVQIQERLTEQIAHALQDATDALGVGVIIQCRHLCMMMRGVEKQNSVMTTSSVLGSFRKNGATRGEFLTLVQSPQNH